MKKYKLVTKKGEGTFSEVVKAQNVEAGSFHAIKCMKEHYGSFQKVNNLREIQALRRLSPHRNIVRLEEVLYDQPSGRLAMVFELMDKNLYDLISGRREHLDSQLVKSLSFQLFTAIEHIHRHGVFHRDIKPENILVDKSGKNLKLADFGSCRGTHSKPPFTGYIATRWYRAPECLLSDGHYGAEMDVWGAGSVLFELIALYPLFPGSDEVDQLNRIHKVLGTPSDDVLKKFNLKSQKSNFNFKPQQAIGIKHFIPNASSTCVNLISKTLVYDYTQRIVAKQCLLHQYFSPFPDTPKLIPEKHLSNKHRIDTKHKIKKVNNKTNPQEASTELEGLPKNIDVPNQKKMKTTTTIKHKKIKQVEDLKASKPIRRRRPAAVVTKLPSVHHRINNGTNGNRNEVPLKAAKKRNKRYANVTSSGYGRNYKPKNIKSLTEDSRTRPRIQHKKTTRLPPIK